jgi:hypothetical protein
LSQEVLVILAIVGILLLIALIKELFALAARKIIHGVGAIIKGAFSIVVWAIKAFFRLLIAPVSLLWGAIIDK